VPPLIDALLALAFLHRLGIRHGDVKPANVVVTSAGPGVLIDLGCAHRREEPERAELSGSLPFIAPELLAGKVVETVKISRRQVRRRRTQWARLRPPESWRAVFCPERSGHRCGPCATTGTEPGGWSPALNRLC
jgi:serine/threonine protein kinase